MLRKLLEENDGCTKYIYTIKNSYGWCYANNICIIIMTFPAMIIQIFDPSIATHTGFWNVIYNFSIATSSSDVALGYTIANAIVYLLLIVGFTFFYIYATFNPAEVSANIKKMVDSYQE